MAQTENDARQEPDIAGQNSPEIRRISGWRQLIALPLALLVRLWGRTLRFEMDPASEAAYRRTDLPIAFTLWHNRLFLVAEIARRYRGGKPVYGLVSASRDGAWLSAFFSAVGIRSVRGSSSKLGREAATALIDVLKGGNDVGITPDGPRGPCYDLKPGALIVARRGHALVLLIGAEFRSAWRLKSWDRFALPLPFSRVSIRAELFTPEQLSGDRNETARLLGERLRAINPDTDL